MKECELTPFRYKPQELTMQEAQPKDKGTAALPDSLSASIYSGITRVTLEQIKNIDLDGYVFLSKNSSFYTNSVCGIILHRVIKNFLFLRCCP